MTTNTQATGGSSRLFRRCLPWILILMGILTVIGGFLYDVIFAGIPYQDPTPEMSARYDHHAGIASVLRWSGVALCVFGMVCGIIRRAAGKASACLLLAMILYPMDAANQLHAATVATVCVNPQDHASSRLQRGEARFAPDIRRWLESDTLG
jgi:hypothetical protein